MRDSVSRVLRRTLISAPLLRQRLCPVRAAFFLKRRGRCCSGGKILKKEKKTAFFSLLSLLNTHMASKPEKPTPRTLTPVEQFMMALMPGSQAACWVALATADSG